MNRQELKLADSDGQIWMQLTSIYNSLDEGHDAYKSIKKLEADLHLDGDRATKLTRRLTVILRNKLWSRFTTSWCRTAIGKETFNASKWNNMISHRLDHVS